MNSKDALEMIRNVADGLLVSGETRAQVAHSLHEAANTIELELEGERRITQQEWLEYCRLYSPEKFGESND
jgi:hypothetical protein